MIIILCARICLRWESDNGRTNYGYNKKKITAPNIKYRQKAGKFFCIKNNKCVGGGWCGGHIPVFIF